MKPEELAKQLVSQIKTAVNASLKEMRSDFDKKLAEMETAFENRFASMPAPEKGEKGDAGADGAVGSDGIAGVAGSQGDRGERGEQGEKGEKGDAGTVDMEEVKDFLTNLVKSLELPKGEKGDKGDAGADAVIDEKQVWDIIAEQFKTVELPTPEKGEKGDAGEVDMEVVRELIGKELACMAIPGGKSITHEEIEDEIKDKSYARGTLAKHRGGIWRARERTKGMAGWECLVAGVANITWVFDGVRTVTITTEKSDGEPDVKTIKIDAPRFRSIFRDGENYEKHDWVQLAGSVWMALKDTKTRPGASDDWQLMVKRGGTGKSAYDLAREAGFAGTRQEWLDSIGKKPVVKI